MPGALRLAALPGLYGSIAQAAAKKKDLEPVLTGKHDVLLDSGASTYAVLTNYALENDLFEQIQPPARRWSCTRSWPAMDRRSAKR
jgi:hypothetical protein